MTQPSDSPGVSAHTGVDPAGLGSLREGYIHALVAQGADECQLASSARLALAQARRRVQQVTAGRRARPRATMLQVRK